LLKLLDTDFLTTLSLVDFLDYVPENLDLFFFSLKLFVDLRSRRIRPWPVHDLATESCTRYRL